jgi:hypothetical protein
MVKNSGLNQPTDMVRLGRLTDSGQPRNSIVFNASDETIRDIKHSGLYISPIRNATASNLLAYDSITKEVVDIGGTQLKLRDLQVENLEVVNASMINEQHVYTPVLYVGEGCKKSEDVGLDIHGIRVIHDKKQGVLTVNEGTKFNGTVEATRFVGDGGLLSNVQYDLNIDIGEVVENLHVVGQLKADGGLLSNITLDQITDFSDYFNILDISKDINVGRSVYVNKRIHSKGNINSDGKVIAESFYGDGTTLRGITKSVELDATNARVSALEKEMPRFEPLEKAKPVFEAEIDALKKETERFTPLESAIPLLESRVSRVEPRVSAFEKELPRISTCEHDIATLRKEVRVLPEIQELRKDVNFINTQTPIIHETKKIVPVVESNADRISAVENTLTRFNEVDALKIKLGTFNYLHGEVKRFEPLEKRVDACESGLDLTKDLPLIRERIQTLEDAPLEGDGHLISNVSLEHVMTCSNVTDIHLVVNNTVSAKEIETECVRSKCLFTYGVPQVTSRLGEVKSLNINGFAEINGYAKANNGTTAGNPGGLVFKTRGTNGKLNPSMTLDGNGKLALGTHKGHPSAILTLESKTSGFLLPRMTLSDIENIPNPEPGLMVYEIENDTLYVYKRSGWTEIK